MVEKRKGDYGSAARGPGVSLMEKRKAMAKKRAKIAHRKKLEQELRDVQEKRAALRHEDYPGQIKDRR